MIVLFTDFGLEGPYTGQMKAVLLREASGVPFVDLFVDAPAGNPKASALSVGVLCPLVSGGDGLSLRC